MVNTSRRKVVQQKIQTLRNKKKPKEKKIKQFSDEEKSLGATSTCNESVENDVKYMSMYYQTVDQVYDEGGLTLVSEKFMKWSIAVIALINLQIDKDKIRRKKN